ncbi:MAG: ParB/RepB/Spo0J family partition protein [Propionibacterium sp.]|nr:ParB/RepB/Spo0J family partition protein [Propionibacterium sp.]
MATKHQTGLGRGLGELFVRTDDEPRTERGGTAERSAPIGDGSYLTTLRVDTVTPNPRQPRQVFDEDELRELAASLSEVGVLQPIVVRDRHDGTFELIMGERRLRAARIAGLDTVPAIIRATDDSDLLRDALLENIHRAQLNPLEEAAAYQQLLDDFGCTQEELSGRIKRSRPQISNTIRLLRLPAPVQRRVAAGVLSAGHARALLSLSDPVAQEQLAQRIVAEGLSVRSTEEVVATRGTDDRSPRTPRTTPVSPRAEDLSSELSDHFDTRVRVSIGRTKGRIVIEFAGEDDLERILAVVKNKETTG